MPALLSAAVWGFAACKCHGEGELKRTAKLGQWEMRKQIGLELSCLSVPPLLALKGGQMFLYAEQAMKPTGPLLLSSIPWSLQPPLVAVSVNDVAAP